MTEKQERINGFMNDLKALYEKHGLLIYADYDGDLYLSDAETRETISEQLNTDTFTAKEYTEPVRKPVDPNAKPLKLSEFNSAMKDATSVLKQTLNEETSNDFLKKLLNKKQ